MVWHDWLGSVIVKILTNKRETGKHVSIFARHCTHLNPADDPSRLSAQIKTNKCFQPVLEDVEENPSLHTIEPHTKTSGIPSLLELKIRSLDNNLVYISGPGPEKREITTVKEHNMAFSSLELKRKNSQSVLRQAVRPCVLNLKLLFEVLGNFFQMPLNHGKVFHERGVDLGHKEYVKTSISYETVKSTNRRKNRKSQGPRFNSPTVSSASFNDVLTQGFWSSEGIFDTYYSLNRMTLENLTQKAPREKENSDVPPT
ncbi:hypothetical protein BB560_001140 [Smittium megazygosporum]|uniref:Uncharacterized protein n=1 Tax=Smittium megazygosporum TaxID=133381 RepID=A0A2T9ZIM3_9FUNG|nr:hypothetical protein BB560_001140 [Smittium megazygosporum]